MNKIASWTFDHTNTSVIDDKVNSFIEHNDIEVISITTAISSGTIFSGGGGVLLTILYKEKDEDN